MKRRRSPRPGPPEGTLGHRIWAQRRAMFMTQEDLAKACGVSQSAVAQWERNTTVPKLRARPRIAGVLHVYAHTLFEGVDEAESA